ncbi:hypothetical protein [Nocardia thailandica]
MVDPGEIHTREDLQQGLAALHRAAGISYLDLAGRPGVTASQGSIHAWVKKDDPTFPQWGNLAPVLRAWGVPETELGQWQAAHARASEEARLRPGVPLGEVLDPFALEVHESITTPATADMKDLPFYVRRAHDDRLGEVVARAVSGASGIAVLLGDSSTGKTRALWEALAPLRARGGWRLWAPSRYRPEELGEQLGRVGSRTVVWLNETQRYFQFLSEPERGRLAETLHALLADGRRGPVLILGSLWHQHYAALCADPGSATRKLLGPATIEVPASFTGDDLAAMRAAAAADPRLQMAVDKADDGQITQYLAGGPELVDFYERRASKIGKAVITAAMDLVRLGHANAIPLTLLREASTAYIDDTTWATRATNWFETALAEISQECKGARGPVSPADDRALNSRMGVRRRRGVPEGEQRYQLADYLDQHSRRERAERTPTVRFWEAAADHADADSQERLGDSAWHRGLYRDAAQLYKIASGAGNSVASSRLFRLKDLFPDDERPIDQAVADIRLDDRSAVDGLLDRDLANHIRQIRLDDPGAVGLFLRELRPVGTDEQIQAVLDRDPANHVRLDKPSWVASLLRELRMLEADQQLQALLDRDPANHVRLDNPYGVVALLGELRAVGADEQIQALLGRDPANHVRLDKPSAVAELLGELRAVGADEQIQALLGRDPANHIRLDDPSGVVALLGELRAVGADEQIQALLGRDPANHVPLDKPSAVAELLNGLRAVGADEQIQALLGRDPANHISLDKPYAVAELLNGLRAVGADEQIQALLGRDPANHISLDNSYAAAELLNGLREVGAQQQSSVLIRRCAATGSFEVYTRNVPGAEEKFRFGREPADELIPAAPWSWTDLD